MSELQDRLKHLVNYSSQLIFVSGDTIAQQQRSLEDFLSLQQENTEISYFTAELSMESADLRRIICRQLLGQKVGSFVRPLKELLKGLVDQPGPFLLCIKQSQMLPNDFLQELWEWVIESKAVSSDHHVNVILFGETAWAEKAKKWLPKKNSSRPVLLSSESVDTTTFDTNALEGLMAESKRPLSLRFMDDEDPVPLVTKKWFIGSVLALLLLVFIGIMAWQYPQQIKHLLKTGELPREESIVADELAEINQVLDQKLRLDETEAEPAMPQTKVETEAPIPEDPIDTETPIELVTSWQDARETSEEKVADIKQKINEEKRQQAEQAKATESQQPNQPIAEEGDFAVPDIISVEQLDQQLGDSLLDAEDKIDDTDSPEQGPNYEFDESMLVSLEEPGVLLQLSGIQNRRVLNEFITDNNLQNKVWVYQTTRYGGAWHVVVLNQRFDSLNDARAAVSGLSQNIQDTEPFAKDLSQIKLEIIQR